TAVVAAVTLLPAILAALGPKVNRWRLGRREPGAEPPAGRGGWGRWIGRVDRRPWTLAARGTPLLGAVALPVLALRLGLPCHAARRPPGGAAGAGGSAGWTGGRGPSPRWAPCCSWWSRCRCSRCGWGCRTTAPRSPAPPPASPTT